MLPRKLIELTLADGKELDIPADSVLLFEEMGKDTNPNFPEGRAFIYYQFGQEIRTAVLQTKVEDLIFELDVNVAPGRWLKLTTQTTGMRLFILPENIQARKALEEGCEIGLQIGESIIAINVKESRREIKKWSEREGPIDIPVQQESEQ